MDSDRLGEEIKLQLFSGLDPGPGKGGAPKKGGHSPPSPRLIECSLTRLGDFPELAADAMLSDC